MDFSKKCRYGLRALIDLAVNSKEERVPLNLIAERNHISLQYLEQVFAALRKKGLVKSVKGSQGGYFLAKKPEDILAAEILEALDGSYLIEDEEMESEAGFGGIPAVIQTMLIDKVNKELDRLFRGISLADMAEAYLVYKEDAKDMYYI